MSTRTTTIRTRQAARKSLLVQDNPVLSDDKENATVNGASEKPKMAKKTSSKAYCSCKRPDDGSPMIHCSSCKDWYHFRCVELSEQEAEEIQTYVCPSCQEKTGARTIKDWEGAEAVEDAHEDDPRTARTPSSSVAKDKPRRAAMSPKTVEEPESDLSSYESDEYAPEAEKAPKRRIRRQSYRSEDESDSEGSHRAKSPKRLRRGNSNEPARKQPSPALASTSVLTPALAPGNPAKRKKSSSSIPPPPPLKRPRSESTAGEDAARKYCLTKLQELFVRIFTRYPFLNQPDEDDDTPRPLLSTKKTEELTEEEKEQLEARAKQFGIDLEQCMYELYSEPDKQGKHIVAGKYKERFRMLTFNLSKADRVVLHMRIASSHISPKELSTMSSTDLASEEEKQSIKKLEEEALAHSILKKSIVPRAKLTHKGLQDIEDVTGAGQREAEREREDEEEERIERERLARLRLQAQRSQSQGSAPPESPVVAQAPAWGAPPPIPLHATAAAGQTSDAVSPTTSSAPPTGMGRPPAHPLFIPSASDFTGLVENELNLADLINIDEEPSGEVPMTPVGTLSTPLGENPPSLSEAPSERTMVRPTPSPITPTHVAGISPFAAKGSQPDTPQRSSFDLNSLWTPNPLDSPSEHQVQPESHDEPSGNATGDRPMNVDLPGGEAEDRDFDMFLNNNEQEQEQKAPDPEPMEITPEVKRAAFEAQSPVWNGTLSMPLDSAIPQEVAVSARQSGGRMLENDSPLWQSLFPSKELRIDGRVPVEKSAQYLTQVRLNPSKELIAVAFSPSQGTDPTGFHALKGHLLSKGRHGLIFPWGHNPKSSAPGRELYVVPLLSTDPLPEFMELLDQLQLPQERTADHLIGVWVLTKGKLVPPPQPPQAIPSASTSTSPAPPPFIAPPPLANIDFSQLQQLQQLSILHQIPHVSQSQSPPHLPFQSHSPASGVISPPNSTAPPAPDLTADVASLTPEQVQLMLQALSKTSSQSPPSGVPIPQNVPSQPIGLPAAALQPWTSQAQYPPSYAPQQPEHPPPYPGNHSPTAIPQPYGDRYDRDRPFGNDGNRGYDSYDRGYRGRGGRGRGTGERGRGRGQGWQKGSSRGRGGPPASGPRSRSGGGGGKWGGEQQRWS